MDMYKNKKLDKELLICYNRDMNKTSLYVIRHCVGFSSHSIWYGHLIYVVGKHTKHIWLPMGVYSLMVLYWRYWSKKNPRKKFNI